MWTHRILLVCQWHTILTSSILNSSCNTTKCGESKGLWILWKYCRYTIYHLYKELWIALTSFSLFSTLSTEWQGEGRGSACGPLHGQREGHQTHRSDRFHQVCPHPHVWDRHEGEPWMDGTIKRECWSDRTVMMMMMVNACLLSLSLCVSAVPSDWGCDGPASERVARQIRRAQADWRCHEWGQRYLCVYMCFLFFLFKKDMFACSYV